MYLFKYKFISDFFLKYEFRFDEFLNTSKIKQYFFLVLVQTIINEKRYGMKKVRNTYVKSVNLISINDNEMFTVKVKS